MPSWKGTDKNPIQSPGLQRRVPRKPSTGAEGYGSGRATEPPAPPPKPAERKRPVAKKAAKKKPKPRG